MYDVIIIGAGPAGLMASTVIDNKKVLLIDKNKEIGRKLLLTGGSRCNVLNLKEPKDFIKSLPTKNRKFLYHALNTFTPKNMYNFFEDNDILLKIEDNDRVFPRSNKASDIVNMFNKKISKKNITLALNESVININLLDDLKEVVTIKNKYRAKNIIISTGGVTYNHTGSTGDGLKFGEKLGHNITELYPSSIPLISNDTIITSKKLQGITLENITLSLKCNNKIIYETTDNLLFTHFGLSGPAALKISEFVYNNLNENNIYLTINVLNDNKEKVISYIKKEKEVNPNLKINKLYKNKIIARYYEYILNDLNINNKYLQELSNKKIIELSDKLTSLKMNIANTKSFNQAFVTGGGIDLKEINPKTMESKLIKGLYFAGEVLDLHGFTGGYNITIALATGYISGINI